MGFKRKRSAADDSSPVSISSFGSCATPDAQSPTSYTNLFDGDMDLDTESTPRFGSARDWFAHAQRVKSSDLGSRTRKRYRDNRPDERVIHETTIQKLFSAQRNLPHASPIPSSQTHPIPEPAAPAPVQKSTLHSFWKIAAPPVQPVQPPTIRIQHHSDAPQAWDVPRCEDCDATLRDDEMDGMVGGDVDMGMGMDVDGGGAVGDRFACNECRRRICGTCAVVSNNRHCLQCATTGREGRWW